MTGWFELKQAANKQYHFTLKAGNGEVILSSEMYTTKNAAQAGIASVQANAASGDRYGKATATNGKFYFTLKAANHQIIGSSQMYASEQSRDAGITSVMTNGVSVEIREIGVSPNPALRGELLQLSLVLRAPYSGARGTD